MARSLEFCMVGDRLVSNDRMKSMSRRIIVSNFLNCSITAEKPDKGDPSGGEVYYDHWRVTSVSSAVYPAVSPLYIWLRRLFKNAVQRGRSEKTPCMLRP